MLIRPPRALLAEVDDPDGRLAPRPDRSDDEAVLELGLVPLDLGRIGGEQRRADRERDDHWASHDALFRGARLSNVPFRCSIPAAAVTTDEYETWFERGVTDGLPVVPPTRERVARMLAGTRRSAGDLLGEMPPNYGRVTVDKAAINAVMAGCRPEYLPVLIAAAEAACDPAFNLHGVATSTHFSAPLVVVNGPVCTRIGLNAGFGVSGLPRERDHRARAPLAHDQRRRRPPG